MTPREQLEMAALAAGYEVFGDRHPDDGLNVLIDGRVCCWRPRHDDGDAFRLAVRLGLSIKHGVEVLDDTGRMSALAYYGNVGECESAHHGDDPDAATRLAIFRAAVEVGIQMRLQNVRNKEMKNEH